MDNPLDHYRGYLLMYGQMMKDLSGNDDYVRSLIEGSDLSDFEQALRKKIGRSPRF